MNPVLKEHLLSALQIFVSSFLTILGASLKAGNVEWSLSFFGALIMAAGGAALKEVFARFLPVSFGGRVGKTAFGHRK